MILALEIFELGSKVKHFFAQRSAYFERRGAGVFIELANFKGGGVRIVA